MEEKENLIAQLKLCDGVILQGGAETDNYEIKTMAVLPGYLRSIFAQRPF